MQTTIVWPHVLAWPFGAGQQAPLQRCFVEVLHFLPVHAGGCCQSNVLSDAPLEIPNAVAICWCESLASNFKRNTSLILHI
jgi:hypothetical protein